MLCVLSAQDFQGQVLIFSMSIFFILMIAETCILDFFGEEGEVDTVQSQQNISFIYLFIFKGFFYGGFCTNFWNKQDKVEIN